MPTKKYRVTLAAEERARLQDLLTGGVAAARKLTRARILLKADEAPAGPGWGDARIADALDVSRPTIERVRQQFVEEGLEAALTRRPPATQPVGKLDGEQEARLVALACSAPPGGRARWTLRLLAERFVLLADDEVGTVSHETVRRTLKKTISSPG
jgi:transposase